MNLKDRVDDLREKDLKEFWPVPLVALSAALGFWLRYIPQKNMEYLQALDPYMIYRLSQHMALSGNLPQLDFMRYFPYATPTYTLNIGDIAIPAYLYNLGPQFFMPYLEWAQLFPALMGAGGIIMMYFLGKEIWDRAAGVSAAFMLAVIAGSLHRTSAGFFEKEPVGTFFMICSLYFFTRSWKRKEEISGILSGVTLGLFTISWGGSRMLWLLYPLVTGLVALIDEDINRLVKTYTPTVLIGGGIAAAINPSRFWITGSLFIANMGLMALLWTRYLAEELSLVEDRQLPYLFPGLSALGLVMAFLSPLYSSWVANRFFGVLNRINQGGGSPTTGVIGGTVAENQAAGIGQLVSQLGAGNAGAVNGLLYILGNVVGTWPLAFLGVSMISTSVIAMLGVKYFTLPKEIEGADYLKLMAVTYFVWLMSFVFFFQGSSGTSMLLAIGPATLLFIAGAISAYSFEALGTINIDLQWYKVLPVAWTVSNVLAAVSRSRLIFLATFSIAIASGYAFSRVAVRIREYDFSGAMPDRPRIESNLGLGLLVVLVLLVGSVNFASGYVQADGWERNGQQVARGLGGSPSQPWMDSLESMKSVAEPGDVYMSWWDYGYWFQSIGRRASLADGGNSKYYNRGTQYGKVNYPLADYLTSTNSSRSELLEKHSVDYIILDSSMIGKYQAVSQISNRNNNEFWAMRNLRTGQMRNALQKGTVTFGSSNLRGLRLYADFEVDEGGNVAYEGAPTLEAGSRRQVGCALTDNGIREFDVENPAKMPGGYFGSKARGERLEVCVAEHPYYSFDRGIRGGQSRLVLVPRRMADSNLNRLYLMNGAGLDYAEPVEEGSNGYVRVWEVTDSQ